MNRVAFLFPGQGSQHSGMGGRLAEAYPESADVFRQADEILGVPLSQTCFGGSEAELALTETTQPAVLAVSVAALCALEARGVRAEAAAGHSLGEYSAHVAAGTVAFADALRTVRLRGRFMQDAVPPGQGSMAVILGLDREQVETLCRRVASGEVVSAANFNGPGQVVIAGHAGAVARAMELALEAGARRAVPLPVSAPFHCSLMEPAARRLAAVLEAAPFEDPRFPVFTNVDAAPVLTGEAARTALVRQVTSPVRWEELVRAMAEAGITTFVEVGPGKVLSGLVKRILKGIRILSVAEPEDLEAAVCELGGDA